MAGYWDQVGGPLSEATVDNIISYVRSLSNVDVLNVSVKGDANRGQKIFGEHCASCHGQNGEGASALSLNNPFFLATATDGFLQYAIRYGRPGTAMLPFIGRLDEQQIDDLTRFVRSWARNVEWTSPVGDVVPSLDNLIINPNGKTPHFTLKEGRYISVDQLFEAVKSQSRLILLDARVKSDWINSHIPGSFPAPYYDDNLFQTMVDALPRDGTWIVAYCACPHAASDDVVRDLRKAGFHTTAVLYDGYFEWVRRKYPVTIGREESVVPQSSTKTAGRRVDARPSRREARP